MFKALNANESGKIDITEFTAAALNKDGLLSDKNLESAFRMLDVNGDGKIGK